MLLSPHAVSAVGKADDPDSSAQESPLWERDTVSNNSTHDGFPALGLLPGLRRHEAAPGGSNLLGDLAFPIMQRIETGLGRQLIP
jgi:hypothetical protein